MAQEQSCDQEARVRVVIVDDTPDIRLLLRRLFARDPRFEVVGEATNGVEAIELVASVRPNLLVLDRNMPVLGGLEALPGLRQASPATAIVLFTTSVDPTTARAAVAAGAVDVLDKGTATPGFADDLARLLVDHWAVADTDVEIRVGPLPSAAARVWIPNTSSILEAAIAHPEVTGIGIPDDVAELLRSFLVSWRAVAEESEEFTWRVRASVVEVERIVEHWALLDAMSDEQMTALGVAWSPPEGQPFFEALTDGVLSALAEHEETQTLRVRLQEQWRPA